MRQHLVGRSCATLPKSPRLRRRTTSKPARTQAHRGRARLLSHPQQAKAAATRCALNFKSGPVPLRGQRGELASGNDDSFNASTRGSPGRADCTAATGTSPRRITAACGSTARKQGWGAALVITTLANGGGRKLTGSTCACNAAGSPSGMRAAPWLGSGRLSSSGDATTGDESRGGRRALCEHCRSRRRPHASSRAGIGGVDSGVWRGGVQCIRLSSVAGGERGQAAGVGAQHVRVGTPRAFRPRARQRWRRTKVRGRHQLPFAAAQQPVRTRATP